MASSFFEKFRRVTASTAYLPEIDGLRFLAVFWVAIIMHTTHYLDEMFYDNHLIKGDAWKYVILEGTHGMYLFFMISGFILSLPFAKAYLKNAEKVSLKRYYLRRLTRLEPPYLIALLIFFLAHVFVVQKYAMSELVPSFFASLIYANGLLLGQQPLVMPVAWSLEIEVQFYVLAPLFCLLFKIKSAILRRALMLIIIIVCLLSISYTHNLTRFLHYFFAGLLLADLYVCRNKEDVDSSLGFVIGIFLLVVLLIIPSYYILPMLAIKLIILFAVFYLVLFNARMKAIFSAKGIALVGGMCYSIYLLHFGIISCFGAVMLSKVKVFDYNLAPLYLVVITILILLISAAYFYYIEKPFMKFKLKRLEQKSKKEVVI